MAKSRGIVRCHGHRVDGYRVKTTVARHRVVGGRMPGSGVSSSRENCPDKDGVHACVKAGRRAAGQESEPSYEL